MSEIPVLKLFISSPGDVGREREMTYRVVRRLNEQFRSRVQLDPYFWEHEPMRATRDFQAQIPEPASFDIVICILWSRLGTRLHASHTRPDGSRYSSGTEYEFENAAEAAMKRGFPELMVYLNQKPPLIPLKPKDKRDEMTRQYDALEAFVHKWFYDMEDRGTLRAAFNTYEDLADYEEKLEVHLTKLIDEKYPATADTPQTREVSWTQGSPFRGLQAFDFDHEEIFFGRTTAIGEILESLRKRVFEKEPAFLLIQGNSGVGKSSVVRAGVLPLLVQPGVIEGVGLWRRAVMHPAEAGGLPIQNLARALVAGPALPELAADGTAVEYLAEVLESNPDNAFLLIKGALSQAAQKVAQEENLDQQPPARLVLLLDQFEEIFTTEGITQKIQESFIAVMRSLAESGLVWVITTMRSDFFHRCDEIPGLIELKAGLGQYQLSPPTVSEIGQIIRKPAQVAGLRFEEDAKTGERLDDLLRDAAASNPASLPLLEFCLEELYQRRNAQDILTFAAYRELGGVEGALARRAEEAFHRLDAETQAAFDAVFRQLVTVSPGEESSVTRRTRNLKDFDSSPAQANLVRALVEDRLLVTGAGADGQPEVSVAHEALLRSWPRLHSWIEASMDFFRERFRLEYALNRWTDEGRTDDLLLREGTALASAEALVAQWRGYLSEEEIQFVERSATYHQARQQRRIRRLQLTMAGFALLAVFAGIASIFAFQQKAQAQAAAEDAREQERIARDQTTIAERERRNSIQTTLQVLDGNFRRSLDRGEYMEAVNWLREARQTAGLLEFPTQEYDIWEQTLQPQINQPLWEMMGRANLYGLEITRDGSTAFLLLDERIYTADLTGDSRNIRVLPIAMPDEPIYGFLLDEERRRLILSDEFSLYAYPLDSHGEDAPLSMLLTGIKGGVFRAHNGDEIWFVREGNLEIHSADLTERLEAHPFPHVDDGYVWQGLLNRESGLVLTHIGNGGNRELHLTRYESGETLFKTDRLGSGKGALADTGSYMLSSESGDAGGRLLLFDKNSPGEPRVISTPWANRNLIDWNDTGFRVTSRDGKIRRWSFEGNLLETIELPGLPTVHGCFPLPNGYLVNSLDVSFFSNGLDWSPEFIAGLRKRMSKQVHYDPEEEAVWVLSDDFLDGINEADGSIFASVRVNIDQFLFPPADQKGVDLIGVRDDRLIAFRIETEDFAGAGAMLPEIHEFNNLPFPDIRKLQPVNADLFLAITDNAAFLVSYDSLHPVHRIVEAPILAAEFFHMYGAEDPTGILLYADKERGRLELITMEGPEFAPSQPVLLPYDPDLVSLAAIATTDNDTDPALYLGTKSGEVLFIDLFHPGISGTLFDFLRDNNPVIAEPESRGVIWRAGDALEITALEPLPFNRLAIGGRGGSLEIVQVVDRNQANLLSTLYPFAGDWTREILGLVNPGDRQLQPNLLLRTQNDAVVLSLGRDASFQESSLVNVGMGENIHTGDMIYAAKDAYIAEIDGDTGTFLQQLEPRGTVGASSLSVLETNPSQSRMVSVDRGTIFTWYSGNNYSRWFANNPEHTLALPNGIWSRSLRFIDDDHIVVGNPGNAVPSIMLIRYEMSEGKPGLVFSETLENLGIRGARPGYVAGTPEVLFFGDNDNSVVWAVDTASKEARSIALNAPPRRMEVVGKDREWLVVSHEGYASVVDTRTLEYVKRIPFPVIGAVGEDYYIREFVAVPDTDYFLAGYKNTVFLVGVEAGRVLRSFPTNGYVWELHISPDQSEIRYVSENGFGTIPFTDLSRPWKPQAPGPALTARARTATGSTTLHSNIVPISSHD